MSAQSSPPGARSARPPSVAEPPSAALGVGDVPFAVMCDGLRAMRSLRPRHGARHGDSTPSATRRAILTTLWKEIAGLAGNARARTLTGHVASARRHRAGRDAELDFTEEQDGFEKSRCSCSAPPGVHRGESAGHLSPAEMLSERDAFVMLCLLAPDLDPEHPIFNLKELKLADHYVDALCLRRNAADAQWLQHYNDRAYRPVDERGATRYADVRDGNFSSVLCAVLKDRCRTRKDSILTIGRVWHLLGVLYQNKEAWGSSFYRKAGTEDLVREELKGFGADGVKEDATSYQKRVGTLSKGGQAKLKREARLAVFRELIQDGTAEENAEFARIVLKDLEIRFKVLPWFHPHAYQHYAQSHDLRKLVRDCQTPGFELGEPEVRPGQYAAVMLTARPARATLGKVASKLATGILEDGSPFFFIEPKLDGERVQLHKIGNTVKTYSRSARESSGIYAQLLRDAVCQVVRATNAILDGEVVVWYKKTDRAEEGWVKFENLRRTTREMSEGNVPFDMFYTLKYIVFDVLYIEHDNEFHVRRQGPPMRQFIGHSSERSIAGGHSRLDALPECSSNVASPAVPLTEDSSPGQTSVPHRPSHSLIKYSLLRRLELLRANFRKKELNSDSSLAFESSSGYAAVVEVIESRKGSCEADLMNALSQLVDSGYEGLIAKNPRKPYMLATRDPACSIKLKPDYFDGGLQDVDVIILGAKRGKGTGTREGRAGELSSFLVGVRTRNSEEARRRYRRNELDLWTPIGSVGTGYTVAELGQLLRRLEGYWRPFDRNDVASWPTFWDTTQSPGSMFRDVSQWIDPRDSVLLQVRAYELVRNSGIALRFPRCERIRPDSEKPFYDAISVDELIELDSSKTPAVIASANGDDEDEVGEAENTSGGKKRKTEEAGVIARLEAANAKVTKAAGGQRRAFEHETGANVSDITERKSVLSGSIFQVYASHGQAEAKHKLERLIYRLGAEFEQRLTSRTTHCVGLRVNDRLVTSHIRTAQSINQDSMSNRLRNISILRPEWLHECDEKGHEIPILRRHLFFAGTDLEASLSTSFDIYGDPWASPADTNLLAQCFLTMDGMASRGDLSTSGTDVEKTEIECVVTRSMRKAGSVFWGIRVVLPNLTSNASTIDLRLLLECFGATVIDADAGKAQTELSLADVGEFAGQYYVLVEAEKSLGSRFCDQLDYDVEVSEKKRNLAQNFVSAHWVHACIRERRLLPAFA